jgi:alkylation response protein AidB-like acyl-CoA dehydrogenase
MAIRPAPAAGQCAVPGEGYCSIEIVRHPLVAAVRDFVEREVRPAASALEHADAYPHALVARMRELGLFGALVPTDYGGLGLDVTTYARVIEELCRGFMSLAGVINSHTMAALIVLEGGTDVQRRAWLPRLARGEARGGLCLTEPHAGSDVQAIQTVARRRGDSYVVTGTKMFVTNGREGNTFALLAVTDPRAEPRHQGMSCFIVEKGHPGLRVAKSIAKLGYKGIDTAELVFEDVVVPAANLVGGAEGRGFRHVMNALETGRINIAARAVGVGQAALEEAIAGVAGAPAPPPLVADLATKVTAARLLTYWAAAMKDRGERCDLEAGMAKLYASEAAHEVAAGALRLGGEEALLTVSTAERHYRDTPLMLIGEGTNEIQRTIIARNLLQRGGERTGAPLSRDAEPEERRAMVQALRLFTEKEIVPAAMEGDRSAASPAELVARLAEMGALGATIPQEFGGLGLDLVTSAMVVEELARGWTALTGIVTAHLTAAHTVARFGTADQRARLLPALTRYELLTSLVLHGDVSARRDHGHWVLGGRVARVENAPAARSFLILARLDARRRSFFLVNRGTAGLSVGAPVPTLGAHGLPVTPVSFDGARVPPAFLIGGVEGHGTEQAAITAQVERVHVAATAVGLAQAAFEAALRYSQQRTAFGKPICEHQAVQLMLADMATAITASRLLVHEAARHGEAPDDPHPRMAKIHASDTAVRVTLDAMRIHGGYGYTKEFPVERFYRDAPRLALATPGNDAERLELARRVAERTSA